MTREWSDPSHMSVWTCVMRGLGCPLQLRGALVVCTWRWGGTEPRHKSTNRLCVRSRLTSSGSRLIPPAARSRCVSPVPLEERKQQINIHLHEASQDIFITGLEPCWTWCSLFRCEAYILHSTIHLFLYIQWTKRVFLSSPDGNNRSRLDCSDDLMELSKKNHLVVKNL